MSKSEKYRDLQVFKIDEPPSFNLPKIPTVCLLAADILTPAVNLNKIIVIFVPTGCIYFMTWGEAADLLHDTLDSLLEDRGGDFLNIVTASHKGESVEDVAWFLINAALPGETNTRYCLGYAENTTEIDNLLKVAQTAIKN